MSNPMDRYLLSNVPHIASLQRTTAQTAEARIERLDEPMQRMQIAVSASQRLTEPCTDYALNKENDASRRGYKFNGFECKEVTVVAGDSMLME